jgi:hypothetical protein
MCEEAMSMTEQVLNGGVGAVLNALFCHTNAVEVWFMITL